METSQIQLDASVSDERRRTMTQQTDAPLDLSSADPAETVPGRLSSFWSESTGGIDPLMNG